MTVRQPFKTDRKLDIARPDNVLDLEILELRIKAELLDDAGVFPCSQFRIILALCTRHHHFARSED